MSDSTEIQNQLNEMNRQLEGVIKTTISQGARIDKTTEDIDTIRKIVINIIEGSDKKLSTLNDKLRDIVDAQSRLETRITTYKTDSENIAICLAKEIESLKILSQTIPDKVSPAKTHDFFIKEKEDKIVMIDYGSNELKNIPVTELAKLTGEGHYAYQTTLGGRIFISGGEGSEGRLCEAVWMGKDSMRLEEMAKMITARNKHRMTLCDSGQYLMASGGDKKGGLFSNTYDVVTKECELYNISKNTWNKMAPLNEARRNHASVEVTEGIIYVFCGVDDDDKYLNSIERFTLTQNVWTQILTDTKISPRSGLGAVSVNGGDVILIGGNTNRDAYRFDSTTNSIELLTEDMGICVSPSCYSLIEKNKKIVFVSYHTGKVFSMPLSSCRAEEIARLNFK